MMLQCGSRVGVSPSGECIVLHGEERDTVSENKYGRILGGKGAERENRKSENRKSIIC